MNDTIFQSTSNYANSGRASTIILGLTLIGALLFIGYTQFTDYYHPTQQATIERLEQENASLISEISTLQANLSIPQGTTTIPACQSEAVEKLTARLLLEGFPQLIEQSNPNLAIDAITLQNTHQEGELLFDPQRNTRLCHIVAEFSIESEPAQANPLFNILYQVYYDQAGELSLSTIKQTLLGQRDAVNEE